MSGIVSSGCSATFACWGRWCRLIEEGHCARRRVFPGPAIETESHGAMGAAPALGAHDHERQPLRQRRTGSKKHNRQRLLVRLGSATAQGRWRLCSASGVQQTYSIVRRLTMAFSNHNTLEKRRLGRNRRRGPQGSIRRLVRTLHRHVNQKPVPLLHCACASRSGGGRAWANEENGYLDVLRYWFPDRRGGCWMDLPG